MEAFSDSLPVNQGYEASAIIAPKSGAYQYGTSLVWYLAIFEFASWRQLLIEKMRCVIRRIDANLNLQG